MSEMDEVELAALFEQQRSRLRAVAYRLLGSLSDADDAVQDAWLRLSRADVAAIDNLSGWLTTVVARISLNLLRARATHAVILPDPVITADEALQPEERAMLADSVGLALLVVLDTLSPAERIAFVLHDSFGFGFDEIASLTGSTPAAARQSASRARRRVRGAEIPTPELDRKRQRAVVDAFFRAANSGDFAGLLAVLHPDVVLRSDFGAVRALAPAVTEGADAVAGQARMFSNPGAELRPVRVNGIAGVIVVINSRPVAVMGFTVVDGLVVNIDAIADPIRVRRLVESAF